MSHMHYLPLAPGFFAILVGFFFIVLILRSVRYACDDEVRVSLKQLAQVWLDAASKLDEQPRHNQSPMLHRGGK